MNYRASSSRLPVGTFAACWLAAGCVSVSSMPQSADQVDFADATVGDTGWSSWRARTRVYAASEDQVFLVARDALAQEGFNFAGGSVDDRAVLGEHGMTLQDWNVVAGVYFTEVVDGTCQICVLVEGSKDLGFTGDDTARPWTQLIVAGIHDQLQEATGLLDVVTKLIRQWQALSAAELQEGRNLSSDPAFRAWSSWHMRMGELTVEFDSGQREAQLKEKVLLASGPYQVRFSDAMESAGYGSEMVAYMVAWGQLQLEIGIRGYRAR